MKNEAHMKNIKEERKRRIENGILAEELDKLENRKRLHNILHKIISFSNEKLNGYKMDVRGDLPCFSGRPVIIAPNHVRAQDIEVIMEAFAYHMFLLSGDHENVHGSFPGFLLEKNGIIYFDMEDKKDRNNVKHVIRDVLDCGVNILWYYEGSWNLSENKIVYDGNYFMVQAAVDSNALVLPVSFDLIEQEGSKRKVACINFGKVIDYNKIYGNVTLSDEEKKEGLSYLKESICCGLFDIWDRYSFIKRDDLARKYSKKLTAEDYFIPDYKRNSPLYSYWQEYKKRILSEWKFNEEDIERKHFVDETVVEQKDAFGHLDKLNLNPNNAFLLSKRNHH